MNAGRRDALRRRALRAYVYLIVIVGGAAIARALWTMPQTPRPLAWLLFVAFGVGAGAFTMKVATVSAIVSVTDTFFITSTLLFGPAAGTIAASIDSLVVSWRRGYRADRIAFNTAQVSLSLWLAGQLYVRVSGMSPLIQTTVPFSALPGSVLLLSAVYFVLNSALPAVAIGLDTRQSPLTIWRKHFLWLSLGFFAAGSVSFCLVLFIQQFSVAAIVLVLPVPIIFHLTLRASFGRLEDAHRHLKDKDRLYLSTIETLAMAIDAKDDVTHSHVRRVQAYAVGLAEALGITDEATIKAIKAAALLHDTGKLAVPEHILNKPGKLTPSEFDKMKLHVDVGADILSLVDFPYPVVPIVRCHHENWDGSGYPRGVKGEEIPIGARILSVVDCYDALTSDRPYRPALSDEGALEILRARRSTMYDPRVVDMFIAVRKKIEIGDAAAPAHLEVLDRIGKTRQEPVPPQPGGPQPAAASDEVLAFVSLARLAAGDVSLADVLALSSKLLRDIVPGVSAAWYVATGDDQVVAMEATGPAAAALRGYAIKVGDRLTGWVAANRQVVVNSDAALDLGPRTAAVAPALTSCLSVPLVDGDALAGVLTLYASARDVFTDDHGRLIQVLAPHVAQAIARARRPADIIPAEKARAAADLRLVSSR